MVLCEGKRERERERKRERKRDRERAVRKIPIVLVCIDIVAEAKPFLVCAELVTVLNIAYSFYVASNTERSGSTSIAVKIVMFFDSTRCIITKTSGHARRHCFCSVAPQADYFEGHLCLWHTELITKNVYQKLYFQSLHKTHSEIVSKKFSKF